MKNSFNIFLLLSLLGIICTGCADEVVVERKKGTIGTTDVYATLTFSHKNFEPINIQTRATLDIAPESRVLNLFVYLFVNGECVYTHYFDGENMVSANQINTAKWNCWYVDNMVNGEEPAIDADATNGLIRMRTKDISGGNLYIIANIDADMVNISPEKLNTIRTEEEIKNLTATLNQDVTSRNGYFPMSAILEDITIANNIVMKDEEMVCAELQRMDAKVNVNVRVATGNVQTKTETENGKTVVTTQKLKNFIPSSWCVVNLPKGAYVMPNKTTDYDESGYFTSDEISFETSHESTFSYTDGNGATATTTSDVHGFSFYMLQNKESMKQTVGTNYHLRDMRNKDANGEYDKNNKELWKYAPEKGTYLIIKGQVEMDVDVSTNAKQQHLAAEVIYYVHLGDFASDKDNYNIERNTHYTYTITIKGVNNIEVEVKTSHTGTFEEKETGATGKVYIAEEEILTFDAHYGQRVYMIDAATIDPENVTWYVSTPFSEGMPEIVAGTEIPSGKDYKWVQFMMNQWADEGKTTYSKNNQSYPGYKGNENQKERSDSLMDVVDFTKYIKTQVRELRAGRENAFRKEKDEDWYEWYKQHNPTTTLTIEDDGIWWRDRIYVTIFVDEYYYEEDPISGNKREGLWKEFVNQPNRLMHILCDNQESLDKASSSTGSVVTIRQRSIQTPYAITHASLSTGWGCETEDESEGHFWFFGPNETSGSTPYSITANNTSKDNGLYNTACLWQLLPNGIFAENQIKWSDFVTYERENPNVEDLDDPLYMVSGKEALLYAPMMRNRDNDGDGYIDADEVRWYIASLGQIYGLYMGQLGLDSDASLYPVNRPSLKDTYYTSGAYTGIDRYRSHIVTSYSENANSFPQKLWAEEGLTVDIYHSYKGYAAYSIRCIRNLGLDYDTESKAQTAIASTTNMPENLIQVGDLITYTDENGNEKTKYQFDLTNINNKSIRYYTTRELEPGDEYSEMSRIYHGFETGDLVTISGQYEGLKALLERGESPCPEGYRVPNIRESALMMLYCPDESWWGNRSNYHLMSTYYSQGKFGTTYKNWYSGNSWFYNGNGHMTAGSNWDNNNVRCVRDWDPL